MVNTLYEIGKNWLPVNMVPGRFQPFTIGHLELAKNAYKYNGYPTVYLVIRSRTGSVISDALTKKIMDAVVKENSKYIAGYVFSGNAYDGVLDICGANRFYKPMTIFCGTDRFQSYYSMIKNLQKEDKIESGKLLDLEVKELNRFAGIAANISATGVRNAITEGNRVSFESMVPHSVTKFWDDLRKEIK